jgi:hypothetical protein
MGAVFLEGLLIKAPFAARAVTLNENNITRDKQITINFFIIKSVLSMDILYFYLF